MPPKRKAVSKISGLVGSDLDDDELIGARRDAPQQQDTETAPPPAKRPRGRPAAAATTAATTSRAKPATRKGRSAVVSGPKGQTAKTTTKTARKSTEENAPEPPAVSAGDVEGYDSEQETRAAQGASEDEDELGSPEMVLPANKKTDDPRGRRGIATEHATRDEESQYTTSGSRRGRPPTKTRGTGRRGGKRRGSMAEPEEEEEKGQDENTSNAENEMPSSHNQEMGIPSYNEHTSPMPISSPSKSQRTGSSQLKKSSTPSQKKKTVRIDETGESDASLRRKLGDMTRKYENMEMKYRNLRDVSVVEANANMEKLRKQCDAMTTASNELVASLKKELAVQTGLAQKSRALQTQLKERDTEISTLESRLEEMSSGLANAQTETRTLQNKLSASRNAAIGAESAKGSGAARPTNARNNAAGGHDATLAAQVAQLKEDLYCDLTGLIVRDAKQQDSQYLYDCIQTGLNGSLHFKLAVTDSPENGTAYDEAEFHYTPLLDSNRDRELLDILPEYLGVDITFSRQNAARFYSRVVDTLTKKRAEG